MRDVADFTSNLVLWIGEILPGADVRAASANEPLARDQSGDADVVLVRLGAVEYSNGARSRAAIEQRLKLSYRIELGFGDAIAEHQAFADLAFAFGERSDLAEGHERIRGEQGALEACFTVERRRDLPQPKPVREARVDLHPVTRFSGLVRAEGDLPLPKARIHILGTSRLVITDQDGAFAFASAGDLPVRARVSAKGRTADVLLKAGEPNLITLAMER